MPEEIVIPYPVIFKVTEKKATAATTLPELTDVIEWHTAPSDYGHAVTVTAILRPLNTPLLRWFRSEALINHECNQAKAVSHAKNVLVENIENWLQRQQDRLPADCHLPALLRAPRPA